MVWNRSTAFLAILAPLLITHSLAAETVLLDFHSAMCGPCRQMRPVIQQLSASGYKVRPVDIQREPQLAAQYGVRRVPTFIAMVDGRETSRVTGMTSITELKQMLGPPAPANQLATVSQAGVAAQPANHDLNSPQTGRIVEIQNPTPNRTQPSAVANPFGNASTRQSNPTHGSPEKHRTLIESTVKITVEDPQGKSAGTGTVVDARSGEALVLTCGHIFRSSAGKGPIAITLFRVSSTGVTEGNTYTGRLIEYDLERDLGLISFRPTEQLKPIRISQSNSFPPGRAVTSVGCNGGQPPTALDSRVTANDRYQGPGNIEIAGAPVEGRSGGGLFSSNGELIGVCFAADPQENEGLYSSLKSIHAKLDSLGLAMIYQNNPTPSSASPIRQVSVPQSAQQPDPSFAVRGQEPAVVPTPSDFALPPRSQPTLSPVEQATFEEIQSRGANSEVICIIRPHDPSAKSEVITLNNASPGFVQKLTEGQNTLSAQRPTHSPAGTQMIR